MKRNLIFPVLFLFVAFISSCEKQTTETTESSNLNIQEENGMPEIVAAEFDEAEYNKIFAENDARLAILGNSSRNIAETAMVPDDYATIQEAVDAVSDGGNVIVKAGTYDENVLVYKPNLHIKAIGDVTVNGGFSLNADADNVKIHQFNIVTTGTGIGANGVTGGELKQNTISGTGGLAIFYRNSSDVSVKQNNISGKSWGIVFAASTADGYSCNNNTFQNNTVTEITYATGIGLQGNCDDNTFLGNTISNNTSTANAGIFFFNFVALGYLCDNNVVKNNTITDNNVSGIWLPAGSDNTIGPNNTSNGNSYGIYLSAATNGTHVFNNTALENTECDITNLGIDNTFKKNTADCTSGL